ncbi:MAG TPA: Arc family DNA-binding protein [Candidatus Limnocylindrales bacterium]
MATLHVRNIPDDLYERLRLRAAARHRSLSAEIIDLLESALGPRDRGAKMTEVLARLRASREALPPVPEGYAADLIREDRGEIEPR